MVLLTLMLVVAAIAVAGAAGHEHHAMGPHPRRNLLAHVPGKRPRYYLMAHRDSKSQPIPLAFRGPAIVLGFWSGQRSS